MELCSNNHTEIAYAKYGTRGCPICKEMDELRNELVEVEGKLKFVEGKLKFAEDGWDNVDNKYRKLYSDCEKWAPHLIV